MPDLTSAHQRVPHNLQEIGSRYLGASLSPDLFRSEPNQIILALGDNKVSMQRSRQGENHVLGFPGILLNA